MRIAFSTLGCKINQYETDRMRHDLAAQGNSIVPFDEEADVYIVNTCSVTAKADTQCRQIIRAAVRRNQKAKVVVTGCYAETRPEEIKKISGVSLIVGNREKLNISCHLDPGITAWTAPEGQPVSVIAVQERTRAFLKIQDGCNNYCSYCIVPFARGRSRSAEPEEVMLEFDRLVQAGSAEIVLTGIHIGTYGNDLAESMSLTELIKALCAKRGDTRIRLSSIEPREVSDGIIHLMGKGLCRHLHIPLQSGDDGILAAMKRNYNSHFYRKLLDKLAQEVPGTALGADVMVGFPGEDERAFQNTMELVETSPLTHLHVFSYSPRPGTVAAGMPHQIPENIKKERSELLRKLGQKKNLDFRNNHHEAVLEVVVEDKKEGETGLFSGLTDNYIRVLIRGAKKDDIGKKIMVRVADVENGKHFADIS